MSLAGECPVREGVQKDCTNVEYASWIVWIIAS
jgi:hypothetical protein